ncbi:MAG TPA: restriction endonuclease subunit S [Lacunisphaera sp.]|nr:restriction endonuclease subunit S [Lacunisphaera sp.]
MEVKPGYKQTELGMIPEDWNVFQLSHQFRIYAGGDVPEHSVSKSRSERHPYPIYANALQDHGLYGFTSERRAKADSLTITARGHLGHAEYREEDFFPIVRLLVLEPLDALDARFTAYAVNERVKFAFESTGVPQLTAPQVAKYSIAAPPIPEQRAIATALRDMDGLLGGLDRLIAKKRDLKQAAMQQLLTSRTRLPGFHGEWTVKTLGDLFSFSGGYSASRDQLSSDGHCYLHYGDIHGATKTTIDVRADYQDIPKLDIPLYRVPSRSLLEDGDVVFVDASEDDEGTSRHVVVVNKDKRPFIAGLHTIVAKSKTDELAHAYRRYCFQTAAIRQQFLFYAVGTKVSGISKTNIAKLTIPVPNIPEQTTIAEVLAEMDAELMALEQRREKTRALKQAMMQELLTGRTRLV